jgi:phosphoribosylamine-glycine ligase
VQEKLDRLVEQLEQEVGHLEEELAHTSRRINENQVTPIRDYVCTANGYPANPKAGNRISVED